MSRNLRSGLASVALLLSLLLVPPIAAPAPGPGNSPNDGYANYTHADGTTAWRWRTLAYSPNDGTTAWRWRTLA